MYSIELLPIIKTNACHPEPGEGWMIVFQMFNNILKMNHYSVYIVECNDGFYYVGVTNDLERRLWEHNTGFDKKCFTYKRRPVELKYYESCSDIKQAIAYEKQLKGWSRKKKQALFKEDLAELKWLSKSTLAKSKSALVINHSSSAKPTNPSPG
jgi:putative endonuclease